MNKKNKTVQVDADLCNDMYLIAYRCINLGEGLTEDFLKGLGNILIELNGKALNRNLRGAYEKYRTAKDDVLRQNAYEEYLDAKHKNEKINEKFALQVQANIARRLSEAEAEKKAKAEAEAEAKAAAEAAEKEAAEQAEKLKKAEREIRHLKTMKIHRARQVYPHTLREKRNK